MTEWFELNARDFPWRKTRNPYHILIAEIVLRRTQANRVVESYNQLTNQYPTPAHMAQEDISILRKLFKPLGLIKRADLLIEASKVIIQKHTGQIPTDLKTISTLPGMGIYSSRALMCLAFNEPVPMIDESSGRLLRRVFCIDFKGPAYSNTKLLHFAASILPSAKAREFNLGLLDIAAAYCHVNKPDCLNCPVQKICMFKKQSTKPPTREGQEANC
ncbi:hypothetical protein MUP38_03995 [Candidatus Bathyarchaeota archaeon]|nr:hypothetical protein [Candidatus Bathyarchaeota archaeon]